MNPKVDIDLVESELCKRSFYEFVKCFWDVIIPDIYSDNFHIEYLCNELQVVGLRVIARKEKAYDLIINISPGSSKSTIVTIMYPCWLWILDPTIKIISGSYSDSLATAHSVKSRDLLKSEKFQRLFKIGFKKDADGKTYYENTAGGVRMATSVGGTITGMHGHMLLIDDPINPKQGASETERNNANQWFDNTLSTRKVDKSITPTILIMQRLHEGDVTGYLLAKTEKRIKHICLPAELSQDVKPAECMEFYKDGLLDPKRLSRAVLDDAKIDLGSYAYAGQFMQRPAPEGGGIIKRDWFTIITPEEYEVLCAKHKPVQNYYLDSAYTANSKRDPSALLSSAFFNNNLYINDVVEVWKELPDLVKFIPEFTKKNNYSSSSRIWVEPKASGLSIVQTFRSSNINVIEMKSPTDDKVTRCHGITAFLEARKCFLVGYKNTPWIEKFLAQCCQFPNGNHDDMVDCLVMAASNSQVNRRPFFIITGKNNSRNSY